MLDAAVAVPPRPSACHTKDTMDLSNLVVCSFYTADEYYRSHADALRKRLEALGVSYVLEEVEKAEGEDWADICRKKIPFLARVCDENPGRKVFWIDVDCSLITLPDFIANFTADIIGFQRGFGSPLTIGYGNRTRFWEPSFFGINSTPSARKYIADAAMLEKNAEIKATDDYFFEESWRSNAPYLSFQIIPSLSVVSRSNGEQGIPAFFSFGSSGKVEEFKNKVVQHEHIGGATAARVWPRMRRSALKVAKRVERALPGRSARALRHVADKTGVTHVLTSGGPMPSGVGGSPHRSRIVSSMIGAAQRGEVEKIEEAFSKLSTTAIPSSAEIAAKRAADTWAHYMTRDPEGRDPIELIWWPRPFPGNFGDWLSPLMLSAHTDRSIRYLPPTAPVTRPHLVSVGSIGRFIKPSSVVVGTGVSSTDLLLDPKAHYISVRGPVTAKLVRESGGPEIASFGDPGLLLSRVLPVERRATNGRIALVRHFKHASVPLVLPDGMDELSVLVSHPDAVRTFVEELNAYDAVVTSAMHVMIACHSYGIPCVLVTFDGFESSVHGTGIKYGDYSQGADLDHLYEPIVVQHDLSRLPLESMLSTEKVRPEKLDEIEQALRSGVEVLLERVELPV